MAGGRRVEKQVYCARESTRVASDHEGGGHDPLPITRNPPPPSSMCKLSRAGGGQRREQLKEVGSATNRTKRRRYRRIVRYSTAITSLTKFYVPPIRTITAIALTAKVRRSGTPTYRAGNSFLIVFVLVSFSVRLRLSWPLWPIRVLHLVLCTLPLVRIYTSMTGGGGSRPTRNRSSSVDRPPENNLVQFYGALP